jgi:hypothetical protein
VGLIQSMQKKMWFRFPNERVRNCAYFIDREGQTWYRCVGAVCICICMYVQSVKTLCMENPAHVHA